MIPFFYPPQPMRIWPESDFFRQLDRNPNWDAEIKYNGWRLMIFIDNDIRMFNRHSTEIDINKNIFRQHFDDVPRGTVLDAELVHFRTTDVKNVIVIWDAPFYDGVDLRKTPLIERRKYLEHFSIAPRTIKRGQKVQVYRTQQFKAGKFKELYQKTVDKNNPLEEGIILKMKNSFYDFNLKRGVESRYWIKIKKIGDHAKV